jgi:hypothetical protein
MLEKYGIWLLVAAVAVWYFFLRPKAVVSAAAAGAFPGYPAGTQPPVAGPIVGPTTLGPTNDVAQDIGAATGALGALGGLVGSLGGIFGGGSSSASSGGSYGAPGTLGDPYGDTSDGGGAGYSSSPW